MIILHMLGFEYYGKYGDTKQVVGHGLTSYKAFDSLY